MRVRWSWLILLWAGFPSLAQEVVPHTQPPTRPGDLSARKVAGLDDSSARETAQSILERQRYWQRDFSSAAAYANSVQPNRDRLRNLIGAVDSRLPVPALELVSRTNSPAKVAETDALTVEAVRWPVFDGVFAEGLRLEPKTPAVACIVALSDADQTPEMLVGLAPGLAPERQFARRLAENGCAVLVPVLIDRQATGSANPAVNRLTNQPHREWIYRQAFPLGRHIIGYEVQKVLAGVDFFYHRRPQGEDKPTRIGVAGYAEGGLIAFYAAALDGRIEATLVSGYFDSRQRLWAEPIYRHVFGLLREFGDAEIASLIAPRALVVEHSAVPEIEGPPASGILTTPEYDSVEAELERARALVNHGSFKAFAGFKLIAGTEGMTTGPGSDRALVALLNALGRPLTELKPPGAAPVDARAGFDPGPRQQRQVKELEDYTRKL